MMQDVSPNAWGSWEHEKAPVTESTHIDGQVTAVYDMYPANWVDAPMETGTPELPGTNQENFVYKEASETGGLGHPTDYGQGMEDFVRAADNAKRESDAEKLSLNERLASKRPLSAALAVGEAAVRLA
jgi:hypothetical protein